MKKLMNKVNGFMRNEEGQGLVEYALIIALVALVVILALTFLGQRVNNVYNNIGGKIL